MELTLEKAYELAVKKWQYIVDNDGKETGLIEANPELSNLKSGCSYCQLYATGSGDCTGCPINLNLPYMACAKEDHLYSKWFNKRTAANAQAVLDLIIKTKPI